MVELDFSRRFRPATRVQLVVAAAAVCIIFVEHARSESTSAARLPAPQQSAPRPADPRPSAPRPAMKGVSESAAVMTGPIKFAPRNPNLQRKPGDAREVVRTAYLQAPSNSVPPSNAAPQPAESRLDLDLTKNPCAAMAEKPLHELGINIAMPSGEFPADPASRCWNELNQSGVPFAGTRCWSGFNFAWDATCLYHHPLYFEEINLERYGYGCCPCVQPFASAAHFFGTIPALPYCIGAECPGECVYTLGHYRPGSCPPRRCHWPPCDPVAALAEGGVWTGLVFLMP